MKSFKRAVYKTGNIIEEIIKAKACNSTLNVDGAEGIYEVEVYLGTGTGIVGLRYDAFAVPDRFQLFFDGAKVADSKYVGNNLTSHKEALLNVNNKVMSVFEYNGTSFVPSGRTENLTITEADISRGTVAEPTFGKGKIEFNKTKALVTTMTLRVIGALGNTLWTATPLCPVSPVVITDSTVTPTPTGGAYTPPVNIYPLIHFPYIPNMSCEDFDQGTIKDYYTTGTLSIGSKMYQDKQLTNVVPTGFLYLGRTIYEVKEGVIVDKYPCHRGVGI